MSIPKDGTYEFELIEDIGVTDIIEEEEGEIKRVIVIGVKYFDAYNACYVCKGKVSVSGSIGECAKCGKMHTVLYS